MKTLDTRDRILWNVKYIGELEDLRGATAAILFDDYFRVTDAKLPEQKQITAQFDDTSVYHPVSDVPLAFGWHDFDAKDFDLAGAFASKKHAYKEAADDYR